jgi:hypothetical protein
MPAALLEPFDAKNNVAKIGHIGLAGSVWPIWQRLAAIGRPRAKISPSGRLDTSAKLRPIVNTNGGQMKHPAKTVRTYKPMVINATFRLKKTDRDVWIKAASRLDESLSQFLRGALRERAAKVLREGEERAA